MIVILLLLVFGCMVVEARRAARNEGLQRARGGIEPPDDVYKVMRVVYPTAFVAMFAEGLARGTPSPGLVVAGAATFAGAKALKWWAIRSLGPSWTFRVLVVPGAPLVAAGPYRWIRHPNYVGVMGELIGVAAMTRALLSGTFAVIVFAALLIRRIAVEERTLHRRL